MRRLLRKYWGGILWVPFLFLAIPLAQEPAIATAPRLGASSGASAPPSLPIGVRALPRITVAGIGGGRSLFGGYARQR